MILGLDVSTSTIGISLMTEEGELMLLTHVSPVVKEKILLKQDELIKKSFLFKDFLIDQKMNNYQIKKIIIEEPLIAAKGTAVIAAMLNQFAGMIFCRLREIFPDVFIDYISVDEARKYGLPEFIHRGVMWKQIPKNICGRKIKDYRKMLVWGQVAQRFPDIVWDLNGRLNVDKKNFDKADSIIVVMGYMQKHKLWDLKKIEYNKTLSFIEKYYFYTDDVFEMEKKEGVANIKKEKRLELFKHHGLDSFFNLK